MVPSPQDNLLFNQLFLTQAKPWLTSLVKSPSYPTSEHAFEKSPHAAFAGLRLNSRVIFMLVTNCSTTTVMGVRQSDNLQADRFGFELGSVTYSLQLPWPFVKCE